MKSSGLLSFLTFVCVVKGLVPPNLRLQRSKRLAASVEPSKGKNDEIGQVKAKIENLEAEIDQVKAALGGRRNDAGDYA